MVEHFNYQYRHWVANKKEMDIVNKREKRPETLRLNKRRKENTKPGRLRSIFDSSLNKKMWVPRQPDKRRRDQVAATDIEFLFRNSEKNRWGGGYFEPKEPKPSSSEEQPSTPEKNTIETEPVFSTQGSEVAKSPSNFLIVDLKD